MPAQLTVWLQHRKAPAKVLIPGCGTGYEARAFAERGHDVLAIDFSDAALDAARRHLGPVPYLQKADFFAFEAQPFDVVYERAFLCALPRSTWPDWGRRVTELVRRGGELAGFFFFDDNEHGPPFGIALHALEALLNENFILMEDMPIPAEQSLAVFKGREHWQVWSRRL